MCTRYNSELAHLAITRGSSQEVWRNNPFEVGTSVRALQFDRLMAMLLRVFSRSTTITWPFVSCIESKTDLFPMLVLQEVTFNTVGIVSH